MDKIKSGRLPQSNCCNCSKQINAASFIGNAKVFPSEGDVTLCVYCGELMIFDERLLLSAVPESKIQEIKAETETWALILRTQKFIRSNQAKAILGSSRN